jgi:hypothetical protein
MELFDKMIMPVLCYGSEVWGFHPGDAVERVHRQFCKNTVNNIVYRELGRTNVQCVRVVRIIKYWLKIVKSPTRLIKTVYDILLVDAENGKGNWVSLLKNLLETYGFGYVWENQGVENDTAFLVVFKQRVRDNFGQMVHRELEGTSRGNSYILYHEHFICAKYLDVVKTERHRIALSRLRSSNHRLAIESGRWHKPQPIPLQERKCQTCNVLEDEFHFVLVCPVYSQLRKQYVSKYYYERPSMFKFIELMSSVNVKTITKLANFVFKAFKMRTI